MHKAKTPEPQPHIWISEIKQDDQVRGQYLVKMKRLASTKKGDPFLTITLSDRTGEIEAKVWEGVEELAPLFKEGDVLDVIDPGRPGERGKLRGKIRISKFFGIDASMGILIQGTGPGTDDILRLAKVEGS